MKNDIETSADVLTEISEDIDVVGPGRILREARQLSGITQQQVADKLNFRKCLVEAIENEDFDLSLPSAFNRGYLKNYAKLVNVSQNDVLNSYDQLGIAQKQCAEMQSFSKITEKQAEHNLLMWITYLIVLSLIVATVVWWYQTPAMQLPTAVENQEQTNSQGSQNAANNVVNANNVDDALAQSETNNSAALNENITHSQGLEKASLNDQKNSDSQHATSVENNMTSIEYNVANLDKKQEPASLAENIENDVTIPSEENSAIALANVTFTFSGDCWVNIYDASGERVAWGMKKSGYVMKVSGQSPFKVTLGRPELVKIKYNDVSVDMSKFNAGNIAKFSIPLEL